MSTAVDDRDGTISKARPKWPPPVGAICNSVLGKVRLDSSLKSRDLLISRLFFDEYEFKSGCEHSHRRSLRYSVRVTMERNGSFQTDIEDRRSSLRRVC